MIVSLLSLQSSHTDDPRVLAAFEETMGRVRAIAQIHEQLYASDDLSAVEVGSYLKALAHDLVALHATVPGGVQLHVDVSEMVLPIDKAIPLGLIANELIVNSLKHGLHRRTGSLRVTLSYAPGDEEGRAFRQSLGSTARRRRRPWISGRFRCRAVPIDGLPPGQFAGSPTAGKPASRASVRG